MKCPGQDSRYWKPGAIFDEKCPKCNSIVEFFKDDTARKCGKCGHRFANPKMDFGCASYCQFAEECVGDLPPEAVAQREDLLKDRIKKELGNLSVILGASYLHDIGIHEAERKHGSTEAKYQEKEGPDIARSIMIKLGAKEELIEEVCDIIGHHHHPRVEETTNFKVVYDSDLIANLEEKHKESPIDKDRLTRIIDKSFLTESGREVARDALLGT